MTDLQAATKQYVDNTAGGDVVGPASATDTAICSFNGTTGKLIQNTTLLANTTGGIWGNVSTSLLAYHLGKKAGHVGGIVLDTSTTVTPSLLSNGESSFLSFGNQFTIVWNDGSPHTTILNPGTPLISENNLSDIKSEPTARSNLGCGTAATKDATDNTHTMVASVAGSFISNHVAIAQDVYGTLEDSGLDSRDLMLSFNDLTDVRSKTSSFNNISPISVKGQLIGSDGSNNIAIPPAPADNYIPVSDASAASGISWKTNSAVAGFVDNAVFCSNGSSSSIDLTNPALNVGNLINSSAGNTWATNGDGISMKCQQTGTYWFSATVPVTVSDGTFGIAWFQFTKNGTLFGPKMPINPLGAHGTAGNEIVNVTVSAIVQVNSGQLIQIHGSCGATPAPYVFYDGVVSNGVNVSILRLL